MERKKKKSLKYKLKHAFDKAFMPIMLICVILFFSFVTLSIWKEEAIESALLKLDITDIWLKGLHNIEVFMLSQNGKYVLTEVIEVNSTEKTNLTSTLEYVSGKEIVMNTTRTTFPKVPLLYYTFKFTVPYYIEGISMFQKITGWYKVYIPEVHNITDSNRWVILGEVR